MSDDPAPTQALEQIGRLQELINDPKAIIYVRDRHGRYVWVSDSYGQQLPFTRSQVIGKTNRELFGEAAGTWEVADGFTRATRDFMTTTESLHDPRTRRWRSFISTKLIATFAGAAYLVGISVELTDASTEAYERHLGELRAALLQRMGGAPA